MSLFGWSYPPGCSDPPDEDEAIELKSVMLLDNSTAWWDEWGKITIQASDGYRIRTLPETVDWDDNLSGEGNIAVATAFLEKHYGNQ